MTCQNTIRIYFLYVPEKKAACFGAVLPIFPVQTASGSTVSLKSFRNPGILKCECLAGLKAQELKSVEVTMLRSRPYFVYCKVMERFASFVVTQVRISEVNVGKKQQLLLGSIFEASVICRSESDSCRKHNFDLSLGLQQKYLN